VSAGGIDLCRIKASDDARRLTIGGPLPPQPFDPQWGDTGYWVTVDLEGPPYLFPCLQPGTYGTRVSYPTPRDGERFEVTVEPRERAELGIVVE